VKAYDNCTAEGLDTIVLESDWKNSGDTESKVQTGISESVQKGFGKMLEIFISYIGNWVNNGTPYELRFYSTGTYRDFRDLRKMFKEDKEFGGEMEIVSVENYTRLNCTFRKKPDELADKVLDYSDQIPNLAAKVLDVKFIYGRQINFAPQKVKVPELEEFMSTAPGSGKGDNNDPSGKTQTKPSSTKK
jgi:hypothetical protein